MKIKNYVVNKVQSIVVREDPIVVELHNRTCSKVHIFKRNTLIVNKEYCRQCINDISKIDTMLLDALKQYKIKTIYDEENRNEARIEYL